jgi:uncharacterized protein YndB with AHSA1/START domain
MRVEIRGETIVGEVEIEASPEVVFDAFSSPEELAAWWGSDDTYRTFNWQVDLRPGGKWSCQARSAADGDTGTVHGVYIEVDRPKVLAYTWNPSWDPGESTEVHITFERVKSGTLLRFVHSGFAGRKEPQEGHTQGWTHVLGWLQTYLLQKESHS